MAKKVWKKYAVGIVGILAIAGVIGTVQKLDGNNFLENQDPTLQANQNIQNQNQDEIEHQFRRDRFEDEFRTHREEGSLRRPHHRAFHDDESSQLNENPDSPWPDQGNGSNSESMRSRAS